MVRKHILIAITTCTEPPYRWLAAQTDTIPPMLVNQNTAIVTSKVVLVPYRKEHVPKYHEWMQSEQLRTLTASEPLTLEEEYAMQESWRKDEDKLTFIILGREDPPTTNLLMSEDIACLQMIGDVNLFIKESEEGEEGGQSHVAKEGEVEVMIAEPAYRRKGLAHAALSAFLHYAITCVLPPGLVLVTRISATNTPSIRLFEKLGFEQIKEPNYFGEIEMRFRGDQTVWGEPGVQVHQQELTP